MLKQNCDGRVVCVVSVEVQPALATAKNHDTKHVGSIGIDPIGCEVLCCVVYRC